MKHVILTLTFCLLALSSAAYSAEDRPKNSYADVLSVIKRWPYRIEQLPTIPLTMFQTMGEEAFRFLVGKRSEEILKDGADFREKSLVKPIHSMGIGATGFAEFYESNYSGLFKGGRFPLIARLSISQGNPYKHKIDGRGNFFYPLEPQPRSVAIAVKIFPTTDKNAKVVTANAVFQNDLNGEMLDNYLDGVLTNHPRVDFTKIREPYEILTLLGVAQGALRNPLDAIKKFPNINPQIRPVHQWSEALEKSPNAVRTPTWIKLRLARETNIRPENDFRLEIYETLKVNPIVYEMLAADDPAPQKKIVWKKVGRLVFQEGYLTKASDQNILFFHSSLRSAFTGELISPSVVPEPVFH